MSKVKVVSYGAGVQSTGLLVLPAQEALDYKTFLFCNVGDDSEHPETLRYFHDVAMPYAKKHGIELIELQKTLKDGTKDTIYQRLTRPNSRSIGIPVRMANGAPGRRSCTADFKVKVVDKWLRSRNAKKQGAVVALGISLDEFHRMKPNMDPETMAWKENIFPLIERRMDRQDCMNIIRRAGLPIPSKSSCWFCPYHRLSVWQEMRQNQPDLFERSVQLEKLINERRKTLGRDKVWFTSKLKPLAEATTEVEQQSLFDEICDSGYCFM